MSNSLDGYLVHFGKLTRQSACPRRATDCVAVCHFAPSTGCRYTVAIDRVNYLYAIDLASVLQKTGEGDRAEVLLDRSEQVIRTMPRLGSAGYGIADVRIDALRSDRSTALTALREAAKAGWRGQIWRYFRDFDPAFASIRDDPEFKAVFADIERDMAQQRGRLAARPKDAPLDLGDKQ